MIATVDDGRRWVLRIPRRAEVSAKVEPEAQVLAMLKNRLPFAVPDWRVVTPSSLPIPCSKTRLRWSSSWFVHARLGRAAGLGGLRGSFATALAALHAVPISAAVDAGCSSVHRRRPVRRW
ncbi:phosphotransferase [Escherichia coli]|uniref:phosphotransferase n=1 Tax=Escherichia coli TaxID=562 RepID=UPI00331D46A0